MTAKEYLTQPEELRSRIGIKKSIRKRYESNSEKYEALSEEIENYNNALKDLEKDITEGILKIKDIRYREILYGLYVEHKKLKEIARGMYYDYNYVCQLHTKALKEFARVNKDKLEE